MTRVRNCYRRPSSNAYNPDPFRLGQRRQQEKGVVEQPPHQAGTTTTTGRQRIKLTPILVVGAAHMDLDTTVHHQLSRRFAGKRGSRARTA